MFRPPSVIPPSQLARSAFPAAILIAGLLAGCRAPQTVRDPEFAPLACPPASCPTPAAVEAALMPETPELAGPHSVEDYVAFALAQNPDIQARRKQVDAAAMRVPQEASLDDPMLDVKGYPFYPYVPQTAAGRKTVDVMVSQEVPWHGKLQTRAQQAEAEVNMARAELAAAELEVVQEVKRVYYELYYAQKAIEITERSRTLASQIRQIAEVKFRAGTVSQQDLLRAELELAEVDADLVRMRQELVSGQARLARLLHVSPETPVAALAELPAEEIPADLDHLYRQAIAARPELHAKLAAIQRDRYGRDLAALQYYPDFTFSFGWGEMTASRAMSPVADGLDDLTVGVAANLPIYRRQLAAGVHEAESKVVASAREYDALRDRTQEEIKDLFAQVTSQQELLRLFDKDILPRAEQTLKVSLPAYETAKIDFLQLIDNWRTLLRYQIARQRQEANLRQNLAALERAVGGASLSAAASPEPVPESEPATPPNP